MIEEPTPLTVLNNFPRPTKAQVTAFRGVPTGFVADALGGGGTLASSIRPVGEGRDVTCVAAGPALTAINGPADILATVAALNFIEPGDILIASVDGHQGCSAAGDRVIGMLRNAGGAAFITDGPVRDYPGIVEVGLPVWCTGLNPASPFTSGPGQIGITAQVAGQSINSGDMIVADQDGVVVVPFARIDEITQRLEHIRALEADLDAEVAAGRKVSQTAMDMLADARSTTYL
ncbi:RraA family protein [Ruegeria atlantica]|uniref:RraA family protein n=1 Tax=Ruegeria atlantica TaxID=81569 RepID=UPI00147F9469|nr:RraA family protein [Ruegeria atlantica]